MHQFDSPTAEELAEDRSWWNIYREAFPSNQQEPPEVILESLRQGAGLAFRIRRNLMTVGIATVHLLREPAAAFLVYIAVAGGQRSGGLGGDLFEHVFAESTTYLIRRGLSPQGMLWEVDSPELAEDAEERMMRRRRIEFFQRHGGILLSRSYFQPPVDGIAPVKMQLMIRPPLSRPAPDESAVDALVHAIYFEKYSAINHISPQTLHQLLRGVQ